jgi:hypothetical protein
VGTGWLTDRRYPHGRQPRPAASPPRRRLAGADHPHEPLGDPCLASPSETPLRTSRCRRPTAAA